MAEDVSVHDLRANLAAVLNETAIRGTITFITSRGRRVAAVVPVQIAEHAQENGHHENPAD